MPLQKEINKSKVSFVRVCVSIQDHKIAKNLFLMSRKLKWHDWKWNNWNMMKYDNKIRQQGLRLLYIVNANLASIMSMKVESYKINRIKQSKVKLSTRHLHCIHAGYNIYMQIFTRLQSCALFRSYHCTYP
jgi:hypothetical protein